MERAKNENPVAPVVTEDIIAKAINQRFEEVTLTANQLRMQMLGVGFTLIQAERELEKMGKLKRGNRFTGKEELGLCGWLAKHCPAVPYKTAMDWKNLAEKALKKIGGKTESALQLMLVKDPALDNATWTRSQLKARKEILSCKTKGALRQMLLPFLGTGTVGRPKGSVGPSDAVAHVSDAELCERLWGNVANAFAPLDRLCALVREMDYQHVQYFIVALQDALSALKERKQKLEN